jgi:hypothetical protein
MGKIFEDLGRPGHFLSASLRDRKWVQVSGAAPSPHTLSAFFAG